MNLRVALSKVGIFVALIVVASTAAAAVKPIQDSEIFVPDTISFEEQLQRHSALLKRLAEAVAQVDLDKEIAKQQNSLPLYLDAEIAYKNIQNVLIPYGIAQKKANALIDSGFRLFSIGPSVCKSVGVECVTVDAMTAVFFFDNQRGLGPELANGVGQAKSGDAKVTVNGFDLGLFLDFLSDKPLDMGTFGLVPAIRNAIIPIDDTGEIAVWIRDPGKRSVDIVKNVMDGTLDAVGLGGNNDIRKAIKKPIDCTVGKLWGRCR